MRKVITIAREFGAGGGEIGRRVAKELGIQFYDKDIILRTALANPKLDPEDVRRWDERVPSSFGFAQSLFDFYNHESCVIVGRNSEYILHEFDHCLHVFAHAGFQWRVKRMSGMMPGVSLDQVASDVKQADRARKKNCEYYTRTVYGDSRNYDLTLNTEKLGIDKAVQLVLAAAEDL